MRRRHFLFTLPALTAAQPGPSYPRLYYSRQTVDSLRARIGRDAGFRGDWEAILERAKRLLSAELVPESVARRGGGQHANYGQPGNQISEMGMVLGLAWQVTGEKVYAEKLRQAMLHYAGFGRWSGQGLDARVPPWRSELNTARFCYGFAAGYDALHEFLSPSDRAAIRDAIVQLGILPTLDDWVLPARRIHALDSMGHNWWSVCVSMAGVAALSILGDEPRAADWVDRVSRGLALWFSYGGEVSRNKPANFDSGGAFYEGPGYANYGLSEYLKYRLAYTNVFPGRPQPRFAALGGATDFFLHTLYPTSGSFYTLNIGDSSLRLRASSTVRLLVENGFAHPLAGWYLRKIGPDGVRGADPLQLVARMPLPPAEPPDRYPTSIIYRDIGWAMMRDSWKDDATLLAVKSGFTWNHAHADAGSFVLFHQGVPLIVDSGACGYDNPAYGGYYVQSRAHNVILFNGQGQPREDIRRGVKTPGRVHDLLDGLDLKYVYADATGPMAPCFTRNYRHWLWTGGAILIFDDIRVLQDGRIDWLLHHDGLATRDGDTVQLASGPASATVRFLHPRGVAVREEEGMPDHEPDRKIPYLVFSAPTEARERKFVVAVVPGGQAIPPVIEPLAGNNVLGVRMRHAGQVTDVYFNLQADGRRMHENSNNVIDGWETDAYLLALTRSESAAATPETVARFFVSSASYLRKGGRVMLDSLSKVTAVWRPAARAEIFLEGQDAAEVSLGAARKPERLTVNGRAAAFSWSESERLASFTWRRGS